MKKERIAINAVLLLLPVLLFLASPLRDAYFVDTKEIKYGILDAGQIAEFGTAEDGWPEIELFFDGRKIEDGRMHIVMFDVTGSIPVLREDFDGPIKLETSGDGQILGFKISYARPSTLDPKIRLDGSTVKIDPLLLNPGDYFGIELLVSGEVEVSSISARIAGIQELTEREYVDRSGLYLEAVIDRPRRAGSSHLRYFRVVPWLAALASFIGMFVFFIIFFATRELSRASSRILVYAVLAYLYTMVLATFGLFALAMIASGGSRLGSVSTIVGVMLFSSVAAWYARKRLKGAG